MFFSVVIPVYNKEKEIRSTLETVLVQSFIDFEVVLVDDGSSDGSMEIVKGIKDSRIRLFFAEEPGSVRCPQCRYQTGGGTIHRLVGCG